MLDEHCIVRACLREGASSADSSAVQHVFEARRLLCFDVIDFLVTEGQNTTKVRSPPPAWLGRNHRDNQTLGDGGGAEPLHATLYTEQSMAKEPMVALLRTLLLALRGEENAWGHRV